MVRGFYQIGSGLMTDSKVLDSVSQNVANVKTTGYKRQAIVKSTFENMMVNRVDQNVTPLGDVKMATVVGQTQNVHTQGVLESTSRNLDFALQGEGFFAVQKDGQTLYTRMGSFQMDPEGYLTVDGGRVLDNNGNPLHVGTEDFTADNSGGLYRDGQLLGRIGVVNFQNYQGLQVAGDGFYTGAGAQRVDNPSIAWKTKEGSNVDMTEEMTNALAAQRELQACAQALKMYDSVLEQATTSLTRI